MYCCPYVISSNISKVCICSDGADAGNDRVYADPEDLEIVTASLDEDPLIAIEVRLDIFEFNEIEFVDIVKLAPGVRFSAGVPAGPVDPVDPVDPAIPVGPVGPVLPVEPVHPVEPVDPVDPVGPVGPVEPVGPVALENGFINIFCLLLHTSKRKRSCWFTYSIEICIDKGL